MAAGVEVVVSSSSRSSINSRGSDGVGRQERNDHDRLDRSDLLLVSPWRRLLLYTSSCVLTLRLVWGRFETTTK